ncbi:DUF3237 domain-containing protein [Fibrella aquatilis]|uniref:UPF0311 protein J2I48_00130 n=1 Tax=Fibrella aquatilis TaxID=2817059 RepID=A0A939JU32_9BACT|nr:DUF3237 domain-containing protein [Fibrella aquatilis]MBO0929377.1 DUF3237 domain-containing protein [Fibrella aquatilis]
MFTSVLRVRQLAFWLWVIAPASLALAQAAPESPRLEFVCELQVAVAPPLVVGDTPHGTRRIVPIKGGTFSGPNLNGTIIDGGADWQIVRPDNTTELNALYTLKTDDGTLIYVVNKGIRVATAEVAKRLLNGEDVAPSEYYFRAAPSFETPPGKYEWLMRSLFIAKGIRKPGGVTIQVWQIH